MLYTAPKNKITPEARITVH